MDVSILVDGEAAFVVEDPHAACTERDLVGAMSKHVIAHQKGISLALVARLGAHATRHANLKLLLSIVVARVAETFRLTELVLHEQRLRRDGTAQLGRIAPDRSISPASNNQQTDGQERMQLHLKSPSSALWRMCDDAVNEHLLGVRRQHQSCEL